MQITTSEQDFQSIGLSYFFDTEEDQNIDWEELFDVKQPVICCI